MTNKNLLNVAANNAKRALSMLLKLYVVYNAIVAVITANEMFKIIEQIIKSASGDESIPTVDSELGRIVCTKHPLFMAVTGARYAMAINVNGSATIIHDNHFEKLSKDDKSVIIHHEIGHLVNGDLNGKKLFQTYIEFIKRLFGNKEIVNREVAADKYAYEHIGYEKVLHALNSLKRGMKSKIARKELDYRISKINELHESELESGWNSIQEDNNRIPEKSISFEDIPPMSDSFKGISPELDEIFETLLNK